MKAFVTGGAGFIASHIVDRLILKGHDVAIIDNLSNGKKENINKKIKFYQRDINDNLDEIFQNERPEIVIHTAAQVMLRKSIEDPIFDAKQNIMGTINILEACRKFGVKKIIYTSTGGARVGEPEYLPVDENHPLNPISPYGISKHTAEHYIFMYNKLYGLDYLIFCFGNVYGPRDDVKSGRVCMIFFDKLMKNEQPSIYGDGEQTRDFIYVLDIANFITESLYKNPTHKLFHLAYGEQISVNRIFDIIKNLIGTNVNPKYVSAIKGEVRDILLDTKLVKKELGWKPEHDIASGLKETYDWILTSN